MIHFKTVPLKYEGTLKDDQFFVPESPSTEAVLNTHARVWKKRYGCLDVELELFNFVADRWPFVNLESRTSQRPQLPLTFSLS
jgi:hypothetical protein